MARSGRNEQLESKKEMQPVVVNERLAHRAMLQGRSDVPVRTVIYVEVGDMQPADMNAAIQHIRKVHGEPAHPTFIVPVRDGKIMSHVEFEAELLDTINKLCEIQDGKIVFRQQAQNIDVMRLRL